MAAKAVAPDGNWLTLAELAKALRISPTTAWRIASDGDLPGFQAITAWRVPAAFLTDLLTVIGSGAQVDLAEFGRQWKAREGELTT